MKGSLLLIICVLLLADTVSSQSDNHEENIYSMPVHPGEPGRKPFWNKYSSRFIYAPAFNMPEVSGAVSYKFTITGIDKQSRHFTAGRPWAALSPLWNEIPEGYTTLIVEGLNKEGVVTGRSGERSFYRSPRFSGQFSQPVNTYSEAGRKGLKAIFDAPNVQYWYSHSEPDPRYSLYCYPNKVIGGVLRAMVSYSQITSDRQEHNAALQIARNTADYLLSVRFSSAACFAGVPPTYLTNVNKPTPEAVRGSKKQWLMVPSVIDAALGFLDLYDVTQDMRYFIAAKTIAETLIKTQEQDGTWPLLADAETGRAVHEQRLIPTSIIFFFDRLAKQYKITDYRSSRSSAWEWIVEHPLKTYEWNGQFEDIHPQESYKNLAREQACDAAVLLLDNAEKYPESIKQAEELFRFVEDQFVFWMPVTDPDGLRKAINHNKRLPEDWITPCVLEQYRVYEPVARSSAILINAFLTAYRVIGNEDYLTKAEALANGLLTAQEWAEKNFDGRGEITTWVRRSKPSNWLNNSYYAAQAILNMAAYKD